MYALISTVIVFGLMESHSQFVEVDKVFPPRPVALLYLNKQMQACAVHIKTYTQPYIDTNVGPQIARKKGFNTKGPISLIQRPRDGNELS